MPRDDMPRWLDLVLQPGVAPILTALNHHGTRDAEQMRRAVGGRAAAVITGRALRQLVAHGVVQRADGGSLDATDDPHGRYQLTSRGAEFAHTAAQLLRLLSERPPAPVQHYPYS
jgi:DNA-binding HxlR family transcriptional regulator